MNLKDKIAIVIGASKGIGVGVVEVFLEKGAHVIAVARDENRLQKLKEKLQPKYANKIEIFSADLTDTESLSKMVSYVLDQHKRVDILCQNAGIFPSVNISDMTEKQWDHVIDTNLKGTFNAIKAVLPTMKAQMYGRIVATSSITGPRVGNPGLGHYGASKAGINGLVKTAAIEFSPYNITINCVEPGNIMTEGLEELGKNYINAQQQAIPLGVLGTPKDIGYAEAFLASDEARYITGQSVVVDGGQLLPESQFDIPRK